MKILDSLVVLCAVVLVDACGENADDSHRQEQVIDGFYQQHIKNPSSGLPGQEELQQLQPFLSSALFALLRKAAEAQDRYHASAAMALPPLVDGDLFTSLFEGATTFTFDSCDSDKLRASCLVRLRHAYGSDHSNGPSHESWRDQLLLVKENQQWRIDDIEFIGNEQSSHREYLSDTLNSIITDYP